MTVPAAISKRRPPAEDEGMSLLQSGEEGLSLTRELPRPTAEELAALQPTTEDMAEIQELEALQANARRYLEDPEEAERIRPIARSALSIEEYLGLYVALALRDLGPGQATGAAAEENLYALCIAARAGLHSGDVPPLPGDGFDTRRDVPPEEQAAEAFDDGGDGAPGGVADSGPDRTEPIVTVYQVLVRDKDARLAEKDREIERLTKALEETQVSLRQQQEKLSRMQEQVDLLSLQQTEEMRPQEKLLWRRRKGKV